MPRRRDAVSSALQNFSDAYSIGRGLRRDWDASRIMREEPEEISAFQGDTELVDPTLQTAVRGVAAAPALGTLDTPAGLALPTSSTVHRYMGEQQSTPFTRSQLSALRNEALADSEARWGDPRRALQMQASNETLAEARRVREEAETKRTNLAGLNERIQGVMQDLADGDATSYNKFIQEAAGGSLPGYMSIDDSDHSLGVMTRTGEGQVGFQRIPPQQLLAYAMHAAQQSDTGLLSDGLNYLFGSVNAEEDRQLGNANTRSQMAAREDQSARGWVGLQSQDRRRQDQSAIDVWKAANGGRGGSGGSGSRGGRGSGPLWDMSEKDLRTQFPEMDLRLKDFDEANAGLFNDPKQGAQVRAARRQIQAEYIYPVMMREDAPRVQEALKQAEPEEIIKAYIDRGYPEDYVLALMQSALPPADPEPEPARSEKGESKKPKVTPEQAKSRTRRGLRESAGAARGQAAAVRASGRRYAPPAAAIQIRPDEGWREEEGRARARAMGFGG